MKKKYMKPEIQVQEFELEDALMDVPTGGASMSGSTDPDW